MTTPPRTFVGHLSGFEFPEWGIVIKSLPKCEEFVFVELMLHIRLL